DAAIRGRSAIVAPPGPGAPERVSRRLGVLTLSSSAGRGTPADCGQLARPPALSAPARSANDLRPHPGPGPGAGTIARPWSAGLGQAAYGLPSAHRAGPPRIRRRCPDRSRHAPPARRSSPPPRIRHHAPWGRLPRRVNLSRPDLPRHRPAVVRALGYRPAGPSRTGTPGRVYEQFPGQQDPLHLDTAGGHGRGVSVAPV